jgi:hypothetical protein
MKRRDEIQLAIFAVSALGYFPFSEWISTTRIGTIFFLWGQMIYLFPLMAAIVALPVMIICLFFQRRRRQSFFYLLISVVFIPCCIVVIILGKRARTMGMESFAQRSQPLINAIEKYELDNSAPPRSLYDLVPDYIPAVPSTGMMAYPEFRYHVGDEAKEQYAYNAWALSVFTPSGGINFDMMLYFPNRNYPQHGYGGWLEAVGDWAYVHE